FAKAALRLIRAFEDRKRAAGQLEFFKRHARQRCEERAERLLAHAAMADMRAGRFFEQRIAHRAALAPTGQTKLAHRFTSAVGLSRSCRTVGALSFIAALRAVA